MGFLQPTLSDFIAANKRIIISGYEGCEKSRNITEELLSNYDGVAIYACKSYSMLKDKQRELCKRYNLTTKQVPIVALNRTDAYLSYYTNRDYPFFIPKQAKIILMTQSALQQQHLFKIIARSNWKPDIKIVVLDEFDVSIGIIPQLDYTLSTFINEEMDERIKNDTISNKFLQKLKKTYSKEDFKKAYEMFLLGENDKPFVCSWIEELHERGIKLVVATSENLAADLLQSIGFNSYRITYPDLEATFNEHTIKIAFNDGIGREFFNRLNSEMAWNNFGDFDTIISDRYKETHEEEAEIINLSQFEENIIEQHKKNPTKKQVINHTEARGSNLIEGNILTILSAIPSAAIKNFTDILNYFNKRQKKNEVDYDVVEKQFYRDRLCQAVGRVIGYRGLWRDNYQTYLLSSKHIAEQLFNITEKDNNIILKLNDKLDIPYSFEPWQPEMPVIDEIIIKSVDDKRNKKKQLNAKLTEKKNKLAKNNFQELLKLFEKSDNDELTYEEINDVLIENNIVSFSGKPLQAKKVADSFGLKVKNTTYRDKATKKLIFKRLVIGLRVKKGVV